MKPQSYISQLTIIYLAVGEEIIMLVRVILLCTTLCKGIKNITESLIGVSCGRLFVTNNRNELEFGAHNQSDIRLERE